MTAPLSVSTFDVPRSFNVGRADFYAQPPARLAPRAPIDAPADDLSHRADRARRRQIC